MTRHLCATPTHAASPPCAPPPGRPLTSRAPAAPLSPPCHHVTLPRGYNDEPGGATATTRGAPPSPPRAPLALTARPLSSDHKPSRPDERARVSARPAAHIASEAALGLTDTAATAAAAPGYESEPPKLYVCRVLGGYIRYGVLFTRSIGDADAHAHLGLIATPETSAGVLGDADAGLVLATDGLWDVVSNAEAAALAGGAAGTADAGAGASEVGAGAGGGGDGAGAALDVQAAAEALVALAARRWAASSERRRDDVTVMVLSFATLSSASAAADAAAARARGEAVSGPAELVGAATAPSEAVPGPGGAAAGGV